MSNVENNIHQDIHYLICLFNYLDIDISSLCHYFFFFEKII